LRGAGTMAVALKARVEKGSAVGDQSGKEEGKGEKNQNNRTAIRHNKVPVKIMGGERKTLGELVLFAHGHEKQPIFKVQKEGRKGMAWGRDSPHNLRKLKN